MGLARRMDADLVWDGSRLQSAQVGQLRAALPPQHTQRFGDLRAAVFHAAEQVRGRLLHGGDSASPRGAFPRSRTSVMTAAGHCVAHEVAAGRQQVAAAAYAAKQAAQPQGAHRKWSPPAGTASL